MFACFFKLTFYLIADLDGICPGGKSYSYRDCRYAVLFSDKAVCLGTQFHPCNVFKVNAGSVRVRLYDDFFKLLRRCQAAFCSNNVCFFEISVCG